MLVNPEGIELLSREAVEGGDEGDEQEERDRIARDTAAAVMSFFILIYPFIV